MHSLMNKKNDNTLNFNINDIHNDKIQTHSPVKSFEGDEIPRFKARQIEAMNYQADLQAILIALLTQFSTVSVGRPHRISHLTKQFIKIKKIVFSDQNDSIDVLQYIQTRSKEQAQYEFKVGNTTKKTAKRRIQPTKRREAMRFLQDILIEFGYFVEVEIETIDGYEGEVTLFLNGHFFLGSNQIKILGNEINKKISSMLQTNANIVLDSRLYNSTFF
ncbi:hypothetical protein EHI8A_071980 [Entamoeba histolytica HM-1:IMSS-B]|uniref:Uncharacterized protein n=6 Tax=Entamoeba histolytica TaxID=5759 RepID=C4LSW1_ENTH1|nr:hypothetical protein EHI_152780 [Entamoeba histolytica HM-1:IMSS]EMD47944.1 ORF 0.75, putative [Entamoeba histolytica KU27]EMH77572.1 hypothetical protein EHI8A_071980 [Entamoeba histolytica HM-1:IMSS-B]EMS11157.1 ORF 0.75, putative [Entamoeba histolytica HM-3:IMSS]ENY60282.1 hypothetical protein EHI7A_069560 [Entamoeba histolytica HM-1:IMSS-A]GAT91531.1 hypothetical protein CL6EHI_152780 [Entamoeba histolytica]|eukprot:XP_655690.2 hypothetical protein EHI_152780 [Entamoeba histolytica HM-1:IMSS]